MIIKDKTVHSKESTLEKQVFVGPFLGPFLALLTMAIALFYYSPQQMELPLAGLVGIYCSWKWRLRGATIAWVLLAAVAAFKGMSSQEPSLWWNLALAASIALACLVTALTQRNVRDHLEWKYQDAVEQQSRLAIVEGRLNTILQTVHQEREDALARIGSLQTEIEKREATKKEEQQFLDIARKELTLTREENEQLQRWIAEEKQKAAIAAEKLEDAKVSLETLQRREETFHKQKEEVINLRHALGAYEHQIASYKDDLQRAKQQLGLIGEMGELIETLTREKSLLETSLNTLQTELDQLKNGQTAGEIVLPDNSPAEFRRLEGFYRQLREQFEEKSYALDTARRELFLTQEKLAAHEREIAEKELASPQISLEEHMQHLERAEEELKQELEQSHQEVKRLYDLVDSVIKK